MNSLAMTSVSMGETLFKSQMSTLQDFTRTVIRLLIITVVLMVILLIASIVVLLMARNMFKDIYLSFLNITEGEFEERSSQLSQLGDIMIKFKNSYYFQDFMGF